MGLESSVRPGEFQDLQRVLDREYATETDGIFVQLHRLGVEENGRRQRVLEEIVR